MDQTRDRELESRLKALDRALEAERIRSGEQSAKLKILAKEVEAQKRAFQGFRDTTIWRLTAPMRRVWRSARWWLGHNTRFKFRDRLSKTNPDSAKSHTPLLHYMTHGRTEGRRSSSFKPSNTTTAFLGHYRNWDTIRERQFSTTIEYIYNKKKYQIDRCFVSIIMPTYNRSAVIAGSIESALNQSHTNFEFIIVDDGSTDDTRVRCRPI